MRHLANILRSGIIAGSIDPFACYITAQNGTVMNEGRTGFTPEQILHMDWLCDAVEGHLPEFDELIDCARPMYRMQASTATAPCRERGRSMKFWQWQTKRSKYLWEYYEPSKLRDIDLIIGCGDLSLHYMNFVRCSAGSGAYVHWQPMMPAMIENRPRCDLH